jgi:Glycosyltransferase like family
MGVEPALGEALAAYRRGERAHAQSIVSELLPAHRGDFRVLHLHGELAVDDRRFDDAVKHLQEAVRLVPNVAEVHFSLARAQWRAGHRDAALAAARRSQSLNPGFAPAALLGAIMESAAGRAEAARVALRASGAADVSNFAARDLAVKFVAAEVEDGRETFARWVRPPRDAPALAFTVVVCSIDAAKLARAQAALRASDASTVQWIVMHDARSLAEAYNRAIARATGDAIVFVHDDVEVLSPAVFAALSRALASADVVGVAGTTRLAGPTIGWGGQEATAGALAHGSSATNAWDYSVLNWTDGVSAGMQALDGCFLAMRADCARALRFDEATFDAFHFYDLDFCLRASRASLRVAIAAEILVAHASRGTVGALWEAQAARFLAKFPELAGQPPRQSHFYAVRFTDPGRVVAMHAEMRGLASLLAPG